MNYSIYGCGDNNHLHNPVLGFVTEVIHGFVLQSLLHGHKQTFKNVWPSVSLCMRSLAFVCRISSSRNGVTHLFRWLCDKWDLKKHMKLYSEDGDGSRRRPWKKLFIKEKKKMRANTEGDQISFIVIWFMHNLFSHVNFYIVFSHDFSLDLFCT